MRDSTLYTIGTALRHAQESNAAVRLLIHGVWLSGQVVASDGMGVILNTERNGHAIVRVDAVSAVVVSTLAPARAALPADEEHVG